MSRQISEETLTLLTNKTGLEPIIIVDIYWTGETATRYADKDLNGISGKILARDAIDDIIKIDVGGNSSSINLTLDDTDGHLKVLIDEFDIHKKNCVVFQYFSGMEIGEEFEIFRGQIYSPIVWNEGERTLSFTVLSQIESREAGFSPEEGQFYGMSPEFIGRVWPLGFGSPIYVPATKVADVAKATAVSFSGIPDATLIYKKELLVNRINQIDEAYNYYSILIAKARNLEVVGQQLQFEYANHLISFTNVKQTLADVAEIFDNICKQIEVLLKDFENPKGDLDRDAIEDIIDGLKDTKDEYIEILKDLYNSKTDHEKTENEFKYRTNILKFEINFIASLRKKCIKLLRDKTRFQRELSIVEDFIRKQNTLFQQNLIVQNAYGFPQNQEQFIEISNVLFSGTLSGRILTLNNILATYSGASLGQAARESTAIDTFWLNDSYTKLDGMYIFTENGYIARVTQQEGNKCIIQLPPKHRSRTKQRRVDYANDNDIKTLFDNTLSRLLTGQETDTQIASIASTIPKTINPFIVDKLTGGNRRIRIKLVNDDPDSPLDFNLETDDDDEVKPFFWVSYEGTKKETELLSPSLTPTQLRDKLVELAPWLTSDNITVVSSESITQGGATFYREYIFDVNDNIPHLFKIKSSQNWLLVDGPQTTVVLEYVGSGTKTATLYIDRVKIVPAQIKLFGYYTVYINGKAVIIYNDQTPTEIEEYLTFKLNLEPDYLTVTGGILTDAETERNPEPLVITVNDEFASIYIDTSQSVIPSSVEELDQPPLLASGPPGPFLIKYLDIEPNSKYIKVLGEPKLVVEYTGVAKKYTRQEMDNILRNDLKRTQIGQAVIKAESVINDLLLSKQTLAVNGLAEEDVDAALNAAYSQLNNLLTSNEYKNLKYTVQDLYDNFPKGSFKLLYEQEIFNFLEYINEANNLVDEQELDQSLLYEFTAVNMGTILEASPVILPKWLDRIANESNQFIKLRLIQTLPQETRPFLINIGDTISLANAFQEKWIANILPSQVHGVYANRSVDGLERLVPVPMSFYTKNENEDFGEYSCTTITLARPLKSIDQSWGDQLYVTYTSTIGPNIVDIISWLVNKYTKLEIDTDSFEHVHTLQTNYPANFALFDKKDSLALITEIAWQARCVTWVNGNKIFIRYLPEEPESITTVTESDIEQNTLKLTFTNTEELITKFEALWKPNYYIQDDYKIVVRRNLTAYDEIVDTFNFNIYNIRELVYKSLTFWIIRRSSTWRRAEFSLFLNKLIIETNDCITIDLQEDFLTTGPIKAIVENSSYDSVSNSIKVDCWLPVLANKKTKYKFSWPKDLTTEDIFPEIQDVISGNAGNPLGLRVPNGTDYEAFDPTVLDQRPDDFGTDKVYDTEDTLPVSLVSEITEVDYEIKSAEKLLLNLDEDEDEDVAVVPPAEVEDSAPEVGQVFAARVIGFVGGTIAGEDVPEGNTEVDVARLQYEFILNDGKIVTAEPLNLESQVIDSVELSGKYMLIRQEDFSYKFYLPNTGRSVTGGNV